MKIIMIPIIIKRRNPKIPIIQKKSPTIAILLKQFVQKGL